ncbi:MAG: glycosyltransferase family 4 protein [Acidobacteriota bacterium]
MIITHVDSETTWRGGQQSLLTLARGLRELGHHQTIVCPANSALAARSADDGFAVADTISRTGDIVHAHSGRAQNQAYRATVGSDVKRVVTRHVAFAPRHRLIHRLKYTYTCDGIIAVSNAVRTTLIDAGIGADKIHVIHTGIEIPTELPTQEQRSIARQHFGLIENAFVVGHIGAFTKEKGQRTVVAAARALQASLPHLRFLLAGDGPLRDELRAQAPTHVLFPGFVEDRALFYAALDLFVMPSTSEAWGLAALEAMAYGVPVIASDIGGLREIVVDGVSGWLVAAEDEAAWSSKIAAIGAEPEKLANVQIAGRRRAEQFSITRMAEQTEALYRSVFG